MFGMGTGGTSSLWPPKPTNGIEPLLLQIGATTLRSNDRSNRMYVQSSSRLDPVQRVAVRMNVGLDC